MSKLDDDIVLLDDFEAWKSQRRLEATDFSGGQFMRERMRAQAYDRVEKALKYVGEPDDWRGTDPEVYVDMMTGLKAILEGSD